VTEKFTTPADRKDWLMDAKSKFREAVRGCDEAADAVVKSDDRASERYWSRSGRSIIGLQSCL
jgi:hypothetical protein